MVDVMRLNDAIKNSYDDWVLNAPPGWFKDDFFEKSRPMVITCKFGQDQPICIPGQENVERERWESERDYRLMRYVTVSVASHHTFVFSFYGRGWSLIYF